MLTASERSALEADLRNATVVDLAYLFGSQAQGRATGTSDLDLAVLTTSPDNVLRQLIDLTAQLEAVTDREVDITRLNDAPPRLLVQVLRHGQLLYAADESTRIQFETRARSKYLDMKPHLDAYDKRVREDLMA